MQNLPVDIQELIFASCNPSSIASFSATCRLSQSVALHSGWPAYNRAHLNAHLHCVTSPLPSREGVKAAWERARWSTLVERGWDDRLLTLQKLHLGMRKTLPVLLLHEEGSRLIIGAGTRLFVILFDDRGRPLLCRPITLGRTCREDVTGVAACEPGSTDDLIVSHLCGWVRRIRLSFYPSTDPHYAWELAFVEVARFDHPAASRLQNISSSGNLFATIATARSSPAHPSRGGVASLYQSRSPWIDPTKVQLQTRPWSVHLSRSSSVGPWLAVGHEGPSPISLFPISESEVLPSPTSLSGEKGRTSAYALSVGATTPNLLAAGLYDGSVRVYDVRSDCRTKDASGKEAMRSVVHLREKFLDSPTYSVAMGGPGGALVAAGSARHSVIRVYDTRYPAKELKSFSLFAGRSPSSVFGLAFESSRLLGVLEDDAFVIESSPDLQLHLRQRRLSDVAHDLQREGRGQFVRYCEHRDAGGKLMEAGRPAKLRRWSKGV